MKIGVWRIRLQPESEHFGCLMIGGGGNVDFEVGEDNWGAEGRRNGSDTLGFHRHN